jgi:hypothetical protein
MKERVCRRDADMIGSRPARRVLYGFLVPREGFREYCHVKSCFLRPDCGRQPSNPYSRQLR